LATELTKNEEWILGRQNSEYKKYEIKIGSKLYDQFRVIIIQIIRK